MSIIETSRSTITNISKDFEGTLVLNASYNDVEIKAIGSNACRNGTIEGVDLRNTKIERIISCAFFECRSLTTVYFPETLTYIGPNAFYKTMIREINLPRTLVNVTGYSFNQAPKINDIIVDPENPVFYSKGRCLFLKENCILIMIARNITSTSEIPDFNMITGIGSCAFTNCNLQSFTGSENLTNIDEFAFHVMTYISVLDLSQTKIVSIPQMAFRHCRAHHIILPHSIKSIGELAFSYASKLTSLKLYYPLESIGQSAFEECPKLHSIYYFGVTDFSLINISLSSKTKVFITPIYKYNLFGGRYVTRNWICKTCHYQLKRSHIFTNSIFLLVVSC